MSIRPALFLAILTPVAFAANSKPSIDVWGTKSGLSFEANRGQTNGIVKYLARTGSGTLFFTATGVVLAGAQASTFELAGANPEARWELLDPTGHSTSYRIGRDDSRWVEGVESYRRLVRHEVYPGIDMVYYGKGSTLEYDFRVAPNADPSRIRLRFGGARSLWIARDGALVVDMPNGSIRHEKPHLFETRRDGSKREISGGFRLAGEMEAAFQVGRHDRTLELAIDPVLDSSAYVGGSGDDSVIAASPFITVGNTTSVDFPGGPFGRLKGTSVFVQTATQIIIYGATGNVVATSASVSNYSSLSAVVGGYTDAADLPVTINASYPYSGHSSVTAWQSSYAGGATDGFLLIVSANNSFLTYVGTPGDDRITAVAASGSTFVVAGTTTGRGLPAGTVTYLGVPANASAGLDGFSITGYSSLPTQVSLYNTVYFGGSGDDTPLAAYQGVAAAYIAGETTSSDFLGGISLSPGLNGPSDAFVVRLPNGSIPLAGILFGGSGTDRGVALAALNDGTVVLAGQTSSTDLPLQNPAQPTYGGGTSDGFLAMFAADLSAVKYATYIGGSGADQATSLTTDFNSSIYVGGWTASTDFPVQNALQPQFGGGPDDGFVVHYDLAGNLQDATYFGGSGSDHILSLAALGGSYVTMVGQTTSADLLAPNPGQSSLKGASDGFVATISSNSIVTVPVLGGKNVRVESGLYLGNAARATTTPVTIASSDPSTVQLAANSTGPGQSSIQLPVLGPTMVYYGQNFFVDCLSDSGGADLTFSAPGFANQVVHASCYPLAISVPSLNTINSYSYVTSGLAVVLVGLQPRAMAVQVVVQGPPGVGAYIVGTRPGAAPIQVQIANSNPAVGTLSSPSVMVSPGSNGTAVTFTPLVMGETFLSLTSADAASPANPLDLVVSSLSGSLTTYVVPTGFQTSAYFQYAPTDSTEALTVTSADPNSVLLSTDPNKPGSGSLTISAGTPFPAVYMQAIAPSGDIGVTASVPGQAPVPVTVHITSPTLVFPYTSYFYSSTPLADPTVLGLGQTINVLAAFGGADPQPTCCYVPNPGSNLALTLTTSNPPAVTIPLPTLAVQPSFTQFSLTAAAAGATTLSIQPPAGIALAANSGKISVRVVSKPLAMAGVEVGNNLATEMVVSLPVPATSAVAVHLAISDPTLALLSPDSKSAGQAQLDLSIPTSGSLLAFYVYGLATSGQAQVTATVAGVGTVTANVVLDPSGFGWSTDSLAVVLYSPLYSLPGISAFALDRATMLPLTVQSLRPGVTPTVSISNGSPSVLTLAGTTVPVPSTLAMPTLLAAGTTILSISVPAGFSRPSTRQSLNVTVQTPGFSLYAMTLGKNLQEALNLNGNPFNSVPGTLQLTVTSSDPTKVLVSADPAVSGSASVTVNYSNWSKITVQALDDNGTVTITVAMPTFTTTTTTVTLYPTGIGLIVNSSQSINQGTNSINGQYFTTTQSPTTSIQPTIVILIPNQPTTYSNSSLRAGLQQLQVNITSSNTAVGTISGSPVALTGAATYSVPTATFTPVGVGETDLTAAPPPGFVSIPGQSTLSINVTAPGFTANNLIFGMDTYGTTQINLPSNVNPPTANLTLTITSSDPSRVLLSTDSNPPTASITQVFVANNRSSGPFLIHALANSGIVPITITAPGYAPSSMNVALTDLTFTFGNVFGTPQQVILQNGPQTLTVSPSLPQNLPKGYSYLGVVVRPGVSITVGIASSDPSTVAVDTPQIVFTSASTQGNATFHPVQTGSATLAISVPAPYVMPPSSSGQMPITVVPAPLYISANSPIGRDLQTPATINVNSAAKPGLVSVSSSDPSRLIISPDGKSAGQGSIALPVSASGTATCYFQSLADNGTATITASASGYQTVSSTITLAPSAAIFYNATYSSTNQINLLTTAGVQHESVSLDVLDPVSLQPRGSQYARAGANLSVSVSTSDPTVLAVNNATLIFSSPDPTNPPQFLVAVQPVAVGTAVLSLGPLPGGQTPANGGALVVNVAEPSFSIPDFTIGYGLEAPAQIKLGSSVPTPTSNLTVSVNTFFPISLSSSATTAGQSSLNVTVPAGQRLSQPFYVQGIGTGSNTLSYSGGGYSSQSNATVTLSTLAFQEAAQFSGVSMAVGSSFSLTVAPALSSAATPVLTPLAIRGGVSPVVLNVTSSNPHVLSVSTSTVTLNPGDQSVKLSVKGLTPGQATVTLSGSGTYSVGSPMVFQVQ